MGLMADISFGFSCKRTREFVLCKQRVVKNDERLEVLSAHWLKIANLSRKHPPESDHRDIGQSQIPPLLKAYSPLFVKLRY